MTSTEVTRRERGREPGNEGGGDELRVTAGINNRANHSYGAAGRVTDVNRAACCFSKHSQEQREREGRGGEAWGPVRANKEG